MTQTTKSKRVTSSKWQIALWRVVTATSLLLPLAPARAADYRIDPKETISTFEVRLFGLIPIRGKFRQTSGLLQLDTPGQSGNIDVLIDATGLEVDSARAQLTARGPEFFNVERYPLIDFKSSRFNFEGSQLHSIDGWLTLTGKRLPISLAIDHANCTPATAREKGICRAEASFSVKRSEFGMKAWSHTMSDDVTIRIAIVALAQPDEIGAQRAAATEPKLPLVVTQPRPAL